MSGSSPDILANGSWQIVGALRRWVEDAPQSPPAFNVAGLIACPTCQAKVDRMCQSKTGRHRIPHSNRTVATFKRKKP